MAVKQQNRDSQLAITAYGLKAATGEYDFALFGAIASMLSVSSENENQHVPSAYGADPALTAAIPIYQDLEPEMRILFGLVDVIEKVADYLLNSDLADQKHLLLVIVPASVASRYQFITVKEWYEIFKLKFTEFSDLNFYFVNADANVVKHIQNACTKLNDDELDSVILAGSDSLLDQITMDELIAERRLCSTTQIDGIIPGEAAASVVIQKVPTDSNHANAIIKSLAYADEPNHGKAHERKMTGLSQAVLSTVQQAGLHQDAIDCVIRNSVTEQHYAFEWYQTSNSLWPNKLPEQQRIAYQLGELPEPPQLKPRKMPEQLNTSMTIGEIGAASIPLSLVLACARFNFKYPAIQNCLVCEANEFPFRGAILLENPQFVTNKNA